MGLGKPATGLSLKIKGGFCGLDRWFGTSFHEADANKDPFFWMNSAIQFNPFMVWTGVVYSEVYWLLYVYIPISICIYIYVDMYMLCYVMLYYIKLYYIIVYSLYYIKYHIILHYMVLYYIILSYTILYYLTPYYILLYYIVLYYIILFYNNLNYIIWYYIILCNVMLCYTKFILYIYIWIHMNLLFARLIHRAVEGWWRYQELGSWSNGMFGHL